MTSRALWLVGLASAALGLVGCERGTPVTSGGEAAPAPAAASLQEVMVASLTPQSNQLWELAGKLYDDDGNLSAAQLSDQEWTTLRDTAAAMQAVSENLASTPQIQVAVPGAKIQSEGTPGALGAAQVQALIDAEPAAFASEAQKMVAIGGDFVSASSARDAKVVDELSGRLNEVCSACHMRFWYPNQATQ